MPSMNHGRESAQTSAFSTPLWLILVKLPTFHQSQNDASNASFELSAAYYIKFPPRMAKKFQLTRQASKPLPALPQCRGIPSLFIYFPPAPKSHAQQNPSGKTTHCRGIPPRQRGATATRPGGWRGGSSPGRTSRGASLCGTGSGRRCCR